jgi:hypothetical protein
MGRSSPVDSQGKEGNPKDDPRDDFKEEDALLGGGVGEREGDVSEALRPAPFCAWCCPGGPLCCSVQHCLCPASEREIGRYVEACCYIEYSYLFYL